MVSEPINLRLGEVKVVDFVPVSCKLTVFKGSFLPIYGAVWHPSKPKIEVIHGI
jgi:hypothetical protein